MAAEKAIKDAGVDPESLDYIILAHNFGDVKYGSKQSDSLPSLASRVKYNLGINNSDCVCYDLIFGCPGWIEGVIQAEAFIKAGIAKKCLVIGTEAPHKFVIFCVTITILNIGDNKTLFNFKSLCISYI